MKIALGVTGCIGAYKAAQVLRTMQELGADVEVIMTRHACEFVQPLTFQALSGHAVITDLFAPTARTDIYHITLAQSIDLLVVAPATANIIAKFAHGIADDFLTTLHLSTPVPLLIAPAMNVEMWRHAATQENVAKLRARGVEFIDPGAGYLACGMVGEGRLAEPQDIAARAIELVKSARTKIAPRELNDLNGEHVLVTAGPTREYLDPIRYISNRSSGKMGYAIAAAAQARGARVTLVSGPVNIAPPDNVELINITTAHEMYEAVMQHFRDATIVIKSAAVCDFRPRAQAAQKIKKSGAELLLEMEKTDDILAALGAQKGTRVLVGFAAETEKLREHAGEKLAAKNLDLIVANDVTSPGAGFDTDTNRVTIIKRNGDAESLPLLSKREVADRVLDAALAAKRAPLSLP